MQTAKKLLVDLLGFTSKLTVLFFVMILFGAVVYWLFVAPLFRPSALQTFSVQGTAKQDVKPDTALINMGATNTSSDVAALKRDSDKAITDTKAAIVALGIAEDTVKSSLTITPNYDYTNTAATIKNYTATASMEVKTTDFTLVDKILDAAISNKLNMISNVSYTIDDPETVKQQIREKAIEVAKEKADKLAEDSGLNLGKVINVVEDNYAYPLFYNTTLSAGAADSVKSNAQAPDSSVNPGLNTISVTVTLVYEID